MADNPLLQFLPLHVLIVEDDMFMAELAADHFRSLGMTVSQATNGKEALAMMEQQMPGLVLCDRLMPEMSGAELLENVRARGADWQQMVFIFVTGLSGHRDRHAMLDLGPDGYICKPVDFASADHDIARAITRKRQET
jgi:CheY-like chemotaxis protein